MTIPPSRHDYSSWSKRFEVMKIHPQHMPEVLETVRKVNLFKPTYYLQASQDSGVPWDVIGCIDALEGSFGHQSYLGNGEPLNRVTRKVPKGRGPWKTWALGASDALKMAMKSQAIQHFDTEIGFCLHFLEWYNGAGYAQMHTASPYLWSYSDQYVSGKYVETKDEHGVYHSHYDPHMVSRQVGAACILKLLREPQSHGLVELS